jgi:3',5'-nucleoside bisphosphate phosphatase
MPLTALQAEVTGRLRHDYAHFGRLFDASRLFGRASWISKEPQLVIAENPAKAVPRLGPDDPVDLHLHTLASDGFWTPSDLVHYLADHGFKVAAICDHDSQRSVLEAIQLGEELGVHIVPGVEVTTNWSGRQWHLLVYGIRPDRTDDDAADFLAILSELDAELQAKAEDDRQRIEASGKPLRSLPEIVAGRPMWPFHVLSSAIKEGHVKNLTEAANLVTQLGGSFTADVALDRSVRAAHKAGGLCVIAHPGRGDSVGAVTEADLDRILKEIPIDGLEAHYRSYTDAQTALYRRLAIDRGLLISCGSDSHAPNQPVDPRPFLAAWCIGLLARLGLPVNVPGEPVWEKGMDPLAAQPAEESSKETQEVVVPAATS